MATILISVPWENIAAAAENVTLSEQGGVLLVNSGDEVIGSSDRAVDTHILTYTGLQNDNKLQNFVMNGRKYVVSYLDSDKWDVKYIIYTPRSVFFQKLNYLWVMVAVELVLCMLVGGFLARYFAQKAFNPIEEMLAMLDERKENPKENSENAAADATTYERLERSLRKLLNSHIDMTKQLAKRDNYIRGEILAGLLKGWNQNGEQVETYLQEIQQRWDSADYRVLLFHVENLEGCKLFERQSEEDKVQAWPLVMFAVQNVLEELLLSDGKGVAVNVDGMLACLFNISNEWDDMGLEEKIQESIRFYKEAFELEVVVAVSGVHSSAQELSLAYEEAQEAAAHRNFWGGEVSEIILYDREMKKTGEMPQLQLQEAERKFLNCVVTRNYQQAEELLDELFEKSMQKDMRYLTYNQCRASGIISMLMGVFSEFSEEAGGIQKMNIIGRLLEATTLPQLKAETHTLFQEITDYYEKKSKSEEPPWIAEVKQYLQENYTDSNINISAIAEVFHLSLSYMGRTFRKFTGDSMLDYIHMLRLTRVKELLDEGSTVKDAAEAVGYLDSKAMIRTFKRYEGITPGQYKKQ